MAKEDTKQSKTRTRTTGKPAGSGATQPRGKRVRAAAASDGGATGTTAAASKNKSKTSGGSSKSKSAKAKTAKTAAPTNGAKTTSSKPKILSRQFLTELATAIRDAVRPLVESGKGREVVGTAQTSGDATFELDAVAEKALLQFLRNAKLPVAYYSEDSGYTTFTSGQPQNLLVVDPVDGSRAAKSGFESCVISIVSTRVIERPTMADVDNALVMEIMGPRTFFAQRGKGAKMYVDGQYKRPKLSKNEDLETMAWTMTVPGRPAELIFPTAAKLIDLTSLKGGFFACNSTAYSLTRLLSNQLDACIDFANRYLRDLEDAVEDQFINAGRGAVLGVSPYDLAGALLIANEAGAVVTNAYGETFDDVLILDSSVANQQSVIAAANKELHKKLLEFFDTRIRQYGRLLERRAQLTGS